MGKVILGRRPERLPAVVTVVLPDGTAGDIPVVFKYRARKEFGELVDRVFSDLGVSNDGATTLHAALENAVVAKNAEYLGEILLDWGLDKPFGPESLEQLADELPGAATAIMQKYREIIQEGRLGN